MTEPAFSRACFRTRLSLLPMIPVQIWCETRRTKLMINRKKKRILVPRSPPGLQELPHLLEQESEGLWYLLAVAFRLLGVRWPLSSPSPSDGGGRSRAASAATSSAAADAAAADGNNSGSGGSRDEDGAFGDDDVGGGGGDGVRLAPWPERRSFDPDAAVVPDDTPREGVRRSGQFLQASQHQQQQQQQRRRVRPPRPASANAAGGSSHAHGNAAVAKPMLVVDDLLEWKGEGDEGPSGAGACWDGTALGRQFLRDEGHALLVRYFVADGEVQRWR